VAEKWKLVKPQAWYNSKKVTLTPVQSSSSRQNTEPVPVDGVPMPTEPATTTTAAPAATSSTPAKPKGLFISAEGIEVVHTVTAEALKAANFERLEHVTVQVWVEHGRRGDVEFELVSPNGIRSVLATERRYDDADTGYPGWKFMSMKHWFVSCTLCTLVLRLGGY
jgi:kexin